MAALGDRGAGAGLGVKPRENEEGRGGVAAPRSGAKRRPDFWRAALVRFAVSAAHYFTLLDFALLGFNLLGFNLLDLALLDLALLDLALLDLALLDLALLDLALACDRMVVGALSCSRASLDGVTAWAARTNRRVRLTMVRFSLGDA